MSSLKITYFRRSQKAEAIANDPPKTTLAYNLFVYRQELHRAVHRPVQLAQSKLQLTESLVSLNAANMIRFAKELMSNLSRIVFYKYKLKRQLKDSADSVKKRPNEQFQRRKAQLKERIESGLQHGINSMD